MEVERGSTDRLVKGAIWLGCGAVGLALIAGVASPAMRRLLTRSALPQPIPATDRPAAHWTPEQVGELIAGIQDARKVGLEPKDYGLAALRGELDRRDGPSLADGSVQLDRLAETSALALADDLSQHGRADQSQFDWHTPPRAKSPRIAAELHAALAQDRLRSWLRSLKAPTLPPVPRHAG
jgi:hypothetical protein